MTAIEWTDVSWNPVTGCDRVSPGCAHCYALDLAARLKGMGQARYQKDGDPKTSGPGFGVTLHPDKLDEPLRWRKPRMVFVNSMSDLFHEQIPDEYIARVFGVMTNRSIWADHSFQVLTKRPERMRDLLAHPEFQRQVRQASGEVGTQWPLPNVWLGVSIENRRFVGRADLLRETPAAVRFISAEPLLGPLIESAAAGASGEPRLHVGAGTGRAAATAAGPGRGEQGQARTRPQQLDLTAIDWLIAGGESGPRARPVKPEWVRDLRDASTATGTAYFFKQWGGRTPKAGGRELDGRTWDEFPARAEAVVAGA